LALSQQMIAALLLYPMQYTTIEGRFH